MPDSEKDLPLDAAVAPTSDTDAPTSGAAAPANDMVPPPGESGPALTDDDAPPSERRPVASAVHAPANDMGFDLGVTREGLGYRDGGCYEDSTAGALGCRCQKTPERPKTGSCRPLASRPTVTPGTSIQVTLGLERVTCPGAHARAAMSVSDAAIIPIPAPSTPPASRYGISESPLMEGDTTAAPTAPPTSGSPSRRATLPAVRPCW